MDAVTPSFESTKRRDMIARLRRVEGQLRGVQRMVDEQEPCEDVARQLTAARRALDRAFYQMIACSLEQELAERRPTPDGQQEAVSHVTRILAKYA